MKSNNSCVLFPAYQLFSMFISNGIPFHFVMWLNIKNSSKKCQKNFSQR